MENCYTNVRYAQLFIILYFHISLDAGYRGFNYIILCKVYPCIRTIPLIKAQGYYFTFKLFYYGSKLSYS